MGHWKPATPVHLQRRPRCSHGKRMSCTDTDTTADCAAKTTCVCVVGRMLGVGADLSSPQDNIVSHCLVSVQETNIFKPIRVFFSLFLCSYWRALVLVFCPSLKTADTTGVAPKER